MWLWVANEPENKQILALSISKEKHVVAERFISNLVITFGLHPVSTDGGTRYPPQACRLRKL